MTSKKIRAYEILGKLAHLQVQEELKILKILWEKEGKIENCIEVLKSELEQEKKFVEQNAPLGHNYLEYENNIKNKISDLRSELTGIRKAIEAEQDVLMDLYSNEKKIEFVRTQFIQKIKKEIEKKEDEALADLILMRRSFTQKSI